MIVIYTDDLSIHTCITKGIVQKAINKLPKFLSNILMKFRVRVYVTDVFKMTGIHGLGCYYFNKAKYGEEVAILIDKKTYSNARYVFYHEVGHFLDDLLGCYKEKVSFTKKNRSMYRFSKTNEYFHNLNLFENDFFIQIKRSNQKNEIFYEDMRESFAESFAEIMTGKRSFKMKRIKDFIVSELKDNFSQFDDESSCNILCNMLQYS